jgi:tetratricopeptide (TPR) repeat protein
VAWASRGVHTNPQSFDAHAALGSALANAQRLDEAIPHFQFCADRAPKSALAQLRLAQALVFANRFEQAISPAEAALKLAAACGANDLAWEHLLLGKALVGAGRTEEGQRHLDTAVRLRPNLASPPTPQ